LAYYLRMRAYSQLRRPQPEAEKVNVAVEAFQMLADSTRERLLGELVEDGIPIANSGTTGTHTTAAELRVPTDTGMTDEHGHQ
jgi:hypothetical protein